MRSPRTNFLYLVIPWLWYARPPEKLRKRSAEPITHNSVGDAISEVGVSEAVETRP